MVLGKGLDSLITKKRGFWSRGELSAQTPVGASLGSERIWQIPLSEISSNPHQPRRLFSHSELEDLVRSIKEHGILQPISVTERSDGGYELIAGERRLRAAEIAELPTIPALVRTATELQKLELALIENIQRQDLNPIEEAFAFKRLVEEFNLSHQEVADQVGKSRPVITNTIRLLDLPEPIQKALIDGAISMSKARAILSLQSEKDQLALFQKILGSGVTVAEVETAVARHGSASRKGSVRRDPNLYTWEQVLQNRLGAKVRIHLRGERGRIEIEFHSREELRRLLTELD